MNQSFKYEFINVNFYEYTIRMTIINNTKMYVVSDILKQYNKINHTDKRIRDWIKRKDTEELLQFCRDKTCTEISAHEKTIDNFDTYRDNSRCGNSLTGNFVEESNMSLISI